MTRKHFEALAESIRFMELDYGTKRHVAEHVANVCKQFNSGFERQRFLEACGVS